MYVMCAAHKCAYKNECNAHNSTKMSESAVEICLARPDILLSVVLWACNGDSSDLMTLKSLSMVNTVFNRVMRRHREDILWGYLTCETDCYGGALYKLYGQLHSLGDMPAARTSTGAMAWYRHGKVHRGNGRAAMVDDRGTFGWYQYGLLHRDDDLPALEFHNGDNMWFQYGWLDREFGKPVITSPNGDRFYISYRMAKWICIGLSAVLLMKCVTAHR